jgi:multiple sugar transport system permease protein
VRTFAPPQLAAGRFRLRSLGRGPAWRDTRTALLFISPFLLFYVVLKLWPIIHGFWISLHRWEIIGTNITFIGADNYLRAFQDRLFWEAATNTVLFTLLAAPALIALGMGLALILNRTLFGGNTFRTLFYLPNVLSVAVIGIIFTAVFRADATGLANWALSLFGLGPVSFLLDATTAMPSIAFTAIWWTVGFNMLILLAGLQNIPEEINDAARVDGANHRQHFWHITLPLLRRPLTFVAILQVIFCFQVFGLIDIMTKGGPGGQTRSLVYYIFERAFLQSQLGYGSAIAFLLFAFLFVLSISQLRLFRRSEDAV